MTQPATGAAVSDTPYDSGFYAAQRDISRRSAERVVPHVLSLVPARSVIDIGCGVGTWLSVFREHGVQDIAGLDGPYVQPAQLLIPRAAFTGCDLEADWAVGRTFDLAVSLEVAEHLSETAAERFVAQLCTLADVVLFSAALPHQGGTAHLNEQWPSWWMARFARQGMQPVDALRRRFWREAEVDLCYRNNAMLFANARGLATWPALAEEAVGSANAVPDIVHPERFEMALAGATMEHLSFLMLVGMLPRAFGRALRRRLGRR